MALSARSYGACSGDNLRKENVSENGGGEKEKERKDRENPIIFSDGRRMKSDFERFWQGIAERSENGTEFNTYRISGAVDLTSCTIAVIYRLTRSVIIPLWFFTVYRPESNYACEIFIKKPKKQKYTIAPARMQIVGTRFGDTFSNILAHDTRIILQ